MLTPSREAIDATMMYGREKLGLATLKPEQETAISNFTLLERLIFLVAGAF